jgi:hypothetical protein
MLFTVCHELRLECEFYLVFHVFQDLSFLHLSFHIVLMLDPFVIQSDSSIVLIISILQGSSLLLSHVIVLLIRVVSWSRCLAYSNWFQFLLLCEWRCLEIILRLFNILSARIFIPNWTCVLLLNSWLRLIHH